MTDNVETTVENTQLDEMRKGTFKAGSKSYFNAGQIVAKRIAAAAAERKAKEKAELESSEKKESKLTKEDIDELNAFLATVNEDFDDFETLDAIVEDLSEEEVEQLDEISKALLGRYVKKAGHSLQRSSYNTGVKDGEEKYSDAAKLYDRSKKRLAGINKAVDKLTKEEAESFVESFGDEQIDEISKATLGRYVGRALNDVRNANMAIGVRHEKYGMFNKIDDKEQAGYHEKNKREAKNREKGIRTAVKKLTKESVEVVNETTAADTLHPGASGGETRSSILAGLIQKVAGMSIEDLSKWNDQALALIGHEADKIDGGAASKNKASVEMKKTTKEDVEALFAGDDLTEEFKEKTSTLFEAAVYNRVATIELELKEAYEETLAEAIKDIAENLTNDLEAYLNDVTETFMKENAVAIETSLKNDITEDFISGLKVLFKEHYMEVPDDKVDVLSGLAEENEGLKAEVNRLVKEKNELTESFNEALKDSLIEEGVEGLTLPEAEKFKTLAESIEFTGDVESYGKKLSYIKENYFKKAPVTSNILTEEFEGETETDVTKDIVIDPSVARYAQAISRTTR